MRSGFCNLSYCTDAGRSKTHGRCRKADCSCPWHDQDIKDRAAELVVPKEAIERSAVDPVDVLREGAEAEVSGELTLVLDSPDSVFAPPGPRVVERWPDALADAVEVLALAAERVEVAAKGLGALPPDDALRLLHRLREAISSARDVDAALSTHIYIKGEHGDLHLPDLPPVSVKRSRERKNWDERGAVFAYVDSQMVARGAEQPDPSEIVDWVLQVVGVQYCRTTPLKAVGLDPKAFCDELPGNIVVRFTD